MSILRAFVIVLPLIGFALSSSCYAQATTATAPASQATAIIATITGVEGIAQVREGVDGKWVKAEVGMQVSEGAEFRTGPRSAVRCSIPPNHTVTLDRMGTMTLLKALRDGNIVQTQIGMPYGRTRYDIDQAGVVNQAEIVTPQSTLAVGGTQLSAYDQPPFAPRAVSLTGRVNFRTFKQQVAFGGKGQGKSEVTSETETPAQYSLLQTFVDPTSSFGRPPQDQKLINQLQSKGDILLNNGQLALAYGGPVTDAQLQDFLSSQGRFNISMRWFGPGDYDMFVLLPDPVTGLPAFTLGNPSYAGSVFKDVGFLDEFVPAVTAGRTPEGGRMKFDQIAFGGGGIELASWDTPVPQIGYTVAIVYYDQRNRIKDYPTENSFRIDAFLDGKRVPVLTNFDEVLAGTATELKFGPTYVGKTSLTLPTLPIPEGDVNVTAVDLTPEATYVDGTPIGNINPEVVTASLKRSAQAAGKKAAKPLTVPKNVPTVVVKKPVKPYPTVEVKPNYPTVVTKKGR